MFILGIWCFMDFNLNSCDRVLHNLFNKLHKETVQTSSCYTDKSKLVEWIYEWNLTGCKPRLLLWYQKRSTIRTTVISFDLVTGGKKFFHRSPRRLAKEKQSVTKEVNFLEWQKQVTPVFVPQSKNIVYRLQESLWIRRKVLYNIIREFSTLCTGI